MLGEQNVMDDNEDEPKPKRQRGEHGGRADRPSQVLKKLLMFYNHKEGEFSQRLTELKQVYRQKLREEVVELRGAAEGVIELGNGRYAITAALRESMLSHSTLLVDCVDEFMGGTKCRDRPQSRRQRQAMLPQAMPEAPPAQPVPAVGLPLIRVVKQTFQTEVEDRSDSASAWSAQELQLAESAPVEKVAATEEAAPVEEVAATEAVAPVEEVAATDEEAPVEEVSATEEAAPAEFAEGEDQYDDAESEDRVDLFSFLLRPQESVFLFGKFAFGKKGG